ncbi:Cysteine--tRNA ligase [Tsuneonella dongtanensis]|uniref:Cysteine--tRNA ligase n=1 Tax=Tsuneonella dongtanensis TaxID=692370 RepID=A0A1B2AE49_9SPHN|nr:cysteine--tRNA ligase [Tsuneonella dongtanensis]ANY20315.1 Cysteine--tRNA ligase [Tsuneonella dongtanensis]
MADLKLFNSLTRSLETFQPIHPGEARVYSCGPTVYNYQHVGNMRAYVFADTLGRVLSFKGYRLTHVINITDVGHLTSDADAGDDKMEKAAASQGKSAWDIARHYQEVFEADLRRLNIREVQHPRATDYVEKMVEWGKAIEGKHAYRLDGGLYFDVSTVPDYGRLARASTDEGEGRIETVEGKRHAADFALWRTTPPGESRQMEWDSPWGRGAPGWHIECSVMSAELLGHPFDIHTGGIDHREIHHPNEIAQNQAHSCGPDTGARIWMHNNFLVDRRGKMSKSTGDFLTLQALVDRGYHPLAYRLLCLQAHYRSELEFTWEGLGAALVRLKRLVAMIEKHRASTDVSEVQDRLANDRAAAIAGLGPNIRELFDDFEGFVSDDLNTPAALVALERAVGVAGTEAAWIVDVLAVVTEMDRVFGLQLSTVSRADLRIRPANATITEDEIEAALARRKEARAAKDFTESDAIRDELAAQGVEVMDGDPLGWEWKL